MNWLAKKVRGWLGIDDYDEKIKKLFARTLENERVLDAQMEMAVDVHMQSSTQIILISRLGGGRVTIIDAHLKSVRDLITLTNRLRQEYGAHTAAAIVDKPHGFAKAYEEI